MFRSTEGMTPAQIAILRAGGDPSTVAAAPLADSSYGPQPLSEEELNQRRGNQQSSQVGQSLIQQMVARLINLSQQEGSYTPQGWRNPASAEEPSPLPVSGESDQTREQMAQAEAMQRYAGLQTGGEPRGTGAQRDEQTQIRVRRQQEKADKNAANARYYRNRNRRTRPQSYDREGRAALSAARTQSLKDSYAFWDNPAVGEAMAAAHYLQQSGYTPYQQEVQARRMVPANMGIFGTGYLPGMRSEES